jgi:predicted MFS family arabinose efflux permease
MFFRVTLPLAAANFINQASRTVMAIVGPVLAVEFALSASELGFLAACMFAAYGLAQLPVGIALDTIGPRRLQAGLMLVAAAGFAVFALSDSLAGFITARILLGIGVSAGLMSIIKGNSQWFAPAQVAGVTGIAMAISSMGSVMTTAPVEAVLPLIGWRGVFWLLCGLAVAASLWIGLAVRDKPAPAGKRSLKSEAAVTGAVIVSPAFWRYAPAVAMLSVLNFTYLGLWAGPWLRDVSGFDGPARAQTLLGYTLAMLVGSLLIGQAASRMQARGHSPFLIPVLGVAGLVAVQVGLLLQPSNPAVVMVLWLAFAFFGSSGVSGYIAVGQMFPPEQTGRVSTAINAIVLAGAFLLQAAIGWILDLWPRSATGGWEPAGYSAAFALSIALHLAAAAHFAGWTRPNQRR